MNAPLRRAKARVLRAERHVRRSAYTRLGRHFFARMADPSRWDAAFPRVPVPLSSASREARRANDMEARRLAQVPLRGPRDEGGWWRSPVVASGCVIYPREMPPPTHDTGGRPKERSEVVSAREGDCCGRVIAVSPSTGRPQRRLCYYCAAQWASDGSTPDGCGAPL